MQLGKKLLTLSLLPLLTLQGLCSEEATKYMVSFPKDVSNKEFKYMKDYITQDLKGDIIYEYSIIKGFTFALPKSLADLTTYLDTKFPDVEFNLELDQPVSI